MNKLMKLAEAYISDFRHGFYNAVETEAKLLDLGFHSIRFPNRGPIRASYLGVEYEF